MAAKQPSNGDLLREIKSMQGAIVKIDGRVEALEVSKIASDASREAVEKYKLDRMQFSERKTKKDLYSQLVLLMVAATALAYALITYLGRTH